MTRYLLIIFAMTFWLCEPGFAQTTGAPIWAGATLTGGGGGEQATQSDAFVDSIGVGTPINYTGVPDDSPNTITLLEQLGVRHYRSGAVAGPGNFRGTYQAPWTTYNTLAAHGIYGDYVYVYQMGDPSTWTPAPDAFASGVTGVVSFEGPNEPNASCGGGSSWASQNRTFMSSLFSYMQSHSSTKNVLLLAPSLGNCSGLQNLYNDAVALGNLQGTGAQVGNMHSYPGFTIIPEAGSLVDSQTSGGAHSYLDSTRVVIPTGPVQTTETGYATDQVSTAAQLKYLLRLLLNAWNNGVSRTYIFELYDEPPGLVPNLWGIVGNSYAPKPSYYAIQNLISILADRGSAFTPGSLVYTLSGNTANVLHTLLQKRDGSFYYIAWEALAAGSAPQAITLTVPSAVTVTGATFTPTGSTTGVSISQAGDAYSFSVTDTPIMIHIQ
jgi:hypothetical protein